MCLWELGNGARSSNVRTVGLQPIHSACNHSNRVSISGLTNTDASSPLYEYCIEFPMVTYCKCFPMPLAPERFPCTLVIVLIAGGRGGGVENTFTFSKSSQWTCRPPCIGGSIVSLQYHMWGYRVGGVEESVIPCLNVILLASTL